jgi:arylsulfate sulfotransferase
MIRECSAPFRFAMGIAAFTKTSLRNVLKGGLAVGLSLTLFGCGQGSRSASGAEVPNEAQESDISVASSRPGVTPFISIVRLVGHSISQLDSVAFEISPQPTSVSQPVNVTWSMTALTNRGYVHYDLIELPVFGLYAGYQNEVTFRLTFNDGSAQQMQYLVVTNPYTDPTGVYLNPTVVKARAPGSALGFNFFIMKSLLGSPVIADTDGQVRWVVPAEATQAVYFANGQFVEGSGNSATVTLLQFDGRQSTLPTDLPQPLLSTFHHNIDSGPNGLLADFNGTDSLGDSVEDIVSEIAPFSNQPPFQTFDMATILSSYMLNNGDDPTAFVRPGIDWFHVNASAYDPSDNTVIISSRENFLIKLDYSTHDIIWILGDPTKYWYTFPSLRAKALALDAGGLYPIGQHAVTVTSDGYVMVFNDGLASINQPSGEPAGLNRAYSEVSVYSINAAAMTAHEVWSFDYGQSIYSRICGSSYEAPGKAYLVDFSTAEGGTEARLVGLDSNLNVVFDFQYPSPSPCGAAWNAVPLGLENLQIN